MVMYKAIFQSALNCWPLLSRLIFSGLKSKMSGYQGDLHNFLKNGPTLASFRLFSFFLNTNFTEQTVGFSGIRTWIIGVEGEDADQLIANTAGGLNT